MKFNNLDQYTMKMTINLIIDTMSGANTDLSDTRRALSGNGYGIFLIVI